MAAGEDTALARCASPAALSLPPANPAAHRANLGHLRIDHQSDDIARAATKSAHQRPRAHLQIVVRTKSANF